jgi:hypothetical protein
MLQMESKHIQVGMIFPSKKGFWRVLIMMEPYLELKENMVIRK